MAQPAGTAGTTSVQVVSTLPAGSGEASPPGWHTAPFAFLPSMYCAMPMTGVSMVEKEQGDVPGAQVDAVQVPPVIN